MNAAQQRLYGRIYMTTTPITRRAHCPYCRFMAQGSRRGRNALARSAQLRGEVMAHIRKAHPEVIEELALPEVK